MNYKILVIPILIVLFLPAIALADPLLDSFSVVSPVPISGGTNATITANCTYSDTNNISYIRDDISYIEVDNLLGRVYFNETTQVTIDNDTEMAYVEFNVPYYQTPNDYNSTCYVSDGLTNLTNSKNITVPEVIAVDINDTSLEYTVSGQSEVYPNQVATTPNIKIENIGNVPLNSQWNGTDFSSGSNTIGVSNITAKEENTLTLHSGNAGGQPRQICNSWGCDDKIPFNNYTANSLYISFYGECNGGSGNAGFNVSTSQGYELLVTNSTVENEGWYYTNTTTISGQYYGYEVLDLDGCEVMIANNYNDTDPTERYAIYSHFTREMNILNNEQLFIGDIDVFDDFYPITLTYYHPQFELYVPFGTPTGEYTNTLTHTISKQ